MTETAKTSTGDKQAALRTKIAAMSATEKDTRVKEIYELSKDQVTPEIEQELNLILLDAIGGN